MPQTAVNAKILQKAHGLVTTIAIPSFILLNLVYFMVICLHNRSRQRHRGEKEQDEAETERPRQDTYAFRALRIISSQESILYLRSYYVT